MSAPLVSIAGSADWHEERRMGIGASEVAAIAGLSSFAKPIDIWSQKLGLTEPSPETPLTRWGHLLEPVVAAEWAEVTEQKVRRASRAVRYHDWPILFAHLDRTVVGGGILEVKTSMTTKGWGESGSSEIPAHVALQVQAQLACADAETAHIAALLGYRDFRTYSVPRDRAFFDEAILPVLREFWRLVETETPPEPDGSDAYGAFLRRANASDDGTERSVTPEEQLLASRLVEVRGQRIAAETIEAELTQRLQAGMGAISKLEGPGWHATWKQTKDRETVDWKLLAASYARVIDDLCTTLANVSDADGIAEVIAIRQDIATLPGIYTQRKPGTRPFLFRVTEEAES